MINKTAIRSLFLLISVSLITSCSHEDFVSKENESGIAEAYYLSLKSSPSVSLLSILNSHSRAINSESKSFTLTEQDLDYLSSLSQSEFETLRDSFADQYNAFVDNEMADLLDSRYQLIFDIIGGHDGMAVLLSFGEEYISMKEGWSSIKDILPDNLTYNQQKVYISMADYVDRIGRPLFNKLLQRDAPDSRSMDILCKDALNAKLMILGINLSAEAVIDIYSGGTAGPVEAIADGAALLELWLDYEVCCQRWH